MQLSINNNFLELKKKRINIAGRKISKTIEKAESGK
jgi:hypothetical protein